MDTQTASPPASDAVGAFVAELLGTTAPLMMILDHMARSAAAKAPPGTPPVMDVISGLLADVFAPLEHRHGFARLDAARELLAEAGEIICSELFIVEPDD